MKGYWLGILLVGCGGSERATVTPDAADAEPADADGCADPLTGTLTDLVGQPVANARIAVSYDDARSTTTDADGAFSLCLCVPTTYFVRLALDAPDGYLDGEIYYENPSLGGATIRTMTPEQAAQDFDYDAARAQVIVYFPSDGTSITVSANHDDPLTIDEPGRYTVYPNVDAAVPSIQVEEGPSLDPPGYGTTQHDLDVAPGKLAFAVLQAPLE
jgi:hypothetical protein